MSHGENPTVMVLFGSGKFAFDFITRTSGTNARIAHVFRKGTAALYDEVGNDPVKCQSVIKTLPCQSHKILNSAGSIIIIKDAFITPLGVCISANLIV